MCFIHSFIHSFIRSFIHVLHSTCASFIHALRSLLLLKVLRLKNSFVADLRDCAFLTDLTAVCLALLFGLNETAASNRKQIHVKFHFSVETYETVQPGFLEIEIKYDGYLVIHR